MTTYPPTPGPSEPEPPEPERHGEETEDGGTPFSGNQPGPAPSGPQPGWSPPGVDPEHTPRPTHGETPGETPKAPADRPFGGIPPAPPPPGAGPAGPSPAGGGYSPYSGGAVPAPPPPPPAYNADGPLVGQGPKNGLGTAALVCGIVAVVVSFIPVVNWFTWALGVLAVVFGSVGWARANKGLATNKPFAITGLVLGIVSFFTFCLIYYVIFGAASTGSYYGMAPLL
jgi:hypothetical protein